MIDLKNIQKRYFLGSNEVRALDGVSFSIEEGDYVALMGPSGSGKSTLMHILGLLDVPTVGSYRIGGNEVSKLTEDDLAILRRETIGFIFQQFNLLHRMSALENVALPLLYSEHGLEYSRAQTLLDRVGLGKRALHRPNELSGGQQQRVAIARSLINLPKILLADEPTGNLDSSSEVEILKILKELNAQGITVIVVTHEEEVGQQAHRLIRMRDGKIQSDERNRPFSAVPRSLVKTEHRRPENRFLEAWEYARQGFKTLLANKVRTALSMLGILIGVAAVVAMLAIGRGAQKAVEESLSSLGSNLLVLRTGSNRVGGVAMERNATPRLTLEDASDLGARVPTLKNVSPNVSGRGQLTYLNRNWNTQVQGVGSAYETMRASAPEMGRFFTEEENRKRSCVAVIGATIARELFEDQNPIGERIKINKINFLVIGVLPEKGASGFRDQDDIVLIPVLTAMHRVLGRIYVDSIDLEVSDLSLMEEAQAQVLDRMADRHRVPPAHRETAYDVRNMADIQAALSQSSQTMSFLLAAIAAISLLVGGIGIMNIMLVSVTERTREIGLRKAIGAKRGDILLQFLSESVVISLVGGVVGIVLGWTITLLVSHFAGWSTSISLGSIALAFGFSATVGVVFGVYPARKASLLNPIEALRHE